MKSAPTVNIIGMDSGSSQGYGWALDGRIVADALRQAGFDVALVNSHFYWGEGLGNNIRARLARELQGLSYRIFKPRRDINVFLERIPYQMFPAARHQVLIPNQEWFPDNWKRLLPRFDAVICKTRAGQEIFSKLGCRAFFSSFTSQDRRQAGPGSKRREFLMMTGKRTGIADRVTAVWRRHPEWPTLTLLGRWISPVDLPNVRVIRDHIAEEEIVALQNDYLFHLGVTAAEGFGHKHNEGMSCGAIVITTDAPPMNEIIAPDRGLLVKWDRSNPKGLGAEYHFAEEDLERAVNECLALKPEELVALSARGRAWYEANDRSFREELPRILRQVCVPDGQ